MNLTVIWRFLVGAYELVRIVCVGGNSFSDYGENVRRHRIQFSRLDDQATGICAPDLKGALMLRT